MDTQSPYPTSKLQTRATKLQEERAATPSNDEGMSGYTSSGGAGGRKFDIHRDIKADVNRAQAHEATFDSILHYFLYLCLEDGNPEKRLVDSLLDQINALPLSQPSAGDLNTLKLLKRGINESLNKIFSTCWDKLMPICNEKDIQTELQEYCKAKTEIDLCKPFSVLSNKILNYASEVKIRGFRGVFEHGLNVQVTDPTNFTSSYNHATRVVRKPDSAFISDVVAWDYNQVSYTGDRTKTPRIGVDQFTSAKKTVNLRWSQLFGCIEFKRTSRPLQFLRNPVYHKDTTRSMEDSAMELTEPYEDDYSSDESDNNTGPAGKGGDQAPVRKLRVKAAAAGEEHKPYTPPEQCATYALELLSEHVGRKHAIILLIIDNLLWVWYYDRQGILRSESIDILQDLPRFVVLLFAFQRFTLEDWGAIPKLGLETLGRCHEPRKPEAVESSRKHSQTTRGKEAIDAREWRSAPVESVKLTPNAFERIVANGKAEDVTTDQVEEFEINIGGDGRLIRKPHCIAGRATSVFSLNSIAFTVTQAPPDTKYVCKLYNPELVRPNEGETLKKIYDVLKLPASQSEGTKGHQDESRYKQNLPVMLFCGDLKGTSTRPVWSVVQFTGSESESGAIAYNAVVRASRITRLLIFEELRPIQEEVTGIDFVKAWAEVVKCHRFLHEKGFEHSDPSLWNMMYNRVQKCGVLTDFDLALPPGLSSPSGFERTGTVPFMALELLTAQYWEGKVLRRYRHELEALIWVLAFVLLRFNNKGIGEDKANTESWMTSSYKTCLEKKFSILSTRFPVQDSFKRQKSFGLRLTAWIVHSNNQRLEDSELEDEAQPKDVLSEDARVNEDKEVWNAFLERIKPLVNQYPELQDVINILDSK
ncbi:unnamed protein product [Cyclocybe aegerita]|uniref:Fungal-type protein kinase domain-containing protein n=1 Tax=Cyclocybe aegerita TaxID=1973307 RepID=A0A8S0VW09_CYCAE|nr:unnamed protein product [Cyclocybe aegerita]